MTYDWSFVCALGGCAGNGTLDTNVTIGPAQVTNIQGTWDGTAITGLTSFEGIDNTILALSPGIALDDEGLSFVTADDLDVNLYYNTSQGEYYYVAIDNTTSSGTFSISPTPIPAALPVFASGLGAFGLLSLRRKRKAAALAA